LKKEVNMNSINKGLIPISLRLTIFSLMIMASVCLENMISPAEAQQQQDQWEELAPMPTARLNLATAIVDGKIYAIGGHQRGVHLNKTEEYDIQTNTWIEKSPTPTMRTMCVAEVVNGKIYVIGGNIPPNNPTGTVEEYDPKTDIWTKKSNMPTPRDWSASAVVDGMIYVIGGQTPNVTSAVERYNPLTDTWETMSKLPKPTTGLAATVVDRRIYVMGGSNDLNFAPISSVFEYEPQNDDWVKKADMPTARWVFSANTINRKIYAIGGGVAIVGNTVKSIASVEMYDPKRDFWEILPDMQEVKSHHSACAGLSEIYIIGGTQSWPQGLDLSQKFSPSNFSVSPSQKILRLWGGIKGN
jgi:N-acetylneuraminic acid mutarotase